MSDTIVAVATASGQAAIAIVRLSGPQALSIAQSLFTPMKKQPIRSHRAIFGTLAWEDKRIDECMLIYYRAPNSYTCEDVVELQVHGSAHSVRLTMDACTILGARIAMPGEFTKLAFLNGRIDLAQAEAVMQVIRAQTDMQAHAALSQLDGCLSREMISLNETLIFLIASLEAVHDYPEEDLQEQSLQEVKVAIDCLAAKLEQLLLESRTGRIVREGLRVVLAGKPNAGKSTLFNALLGQSRAIVTDVPGTTRDTLEEAIDLGGIPVILVDTAGLHESNDVVERFGIDRAQAAMQAADLILWVVDGLSVDLDEMAERSPNDEIPVLRVLSKIDMSEHISDSTKVDLEISAHSGEGMQALIQAIRDHALGHSSGYDHMLTQQRHIEAVRSATMSVRSALVSLDAGMPLECAIIDLREAAGCIGAITGQQVDDRVIDAIFAHFCVGK